MYFYFYIYVIISFSKLYLNLYCYVISNSPVLFLEFFVSWKTRIRIFGRPVNFLHEIFHCAESSFLIYYLPLCQNKFEILCQSCQIGSLKIGSLSVGLFRILCWLCLIRQFLIEYWLFNICTLNTPCIHSPYTNLPGLWLELEHTTWHGLRQSTQRSLINRAVHLHSHMPAQLLPPQESQTN